MWIEFSINSLVSYFLKYFIDKNKLNYLTQATISHVLHVQSENVHARLSSIVILCLTFQIFAVPHSKLLTSWNFHGYSKVVKC